MEIIGAPVDRVDGRLKVTGTALYSGDVELSRMAHAVLVLSTVASGRIAAMDTEHAVRMPGVLAILTHLNAWKLPDGGRAGVNPPAGRVLTLLQDDKVHFDRQPIAVVVAESLDQAAAGGRQVGVRYSPESATLSFLEAKSDAHAPEKVNQEPAASERGRIPVEAVARVESVYATPMEQHNPMEPHATVAQ